MKAPKGYAKVAGAAEPAGSHIGCKEYLMTVSSRLYFSSFYRLVYFFMIASSVVCVAWTGMNNWKMYVLLTVKRWNGQQIINECIDRFWHKWCNVFDVVALVMSLVSVAMYFNEGEGVLGELEEVAADSVLALRNAVQYVRLAIFLKNRSDQPTTIGKDIDFEELAVHPDDEREIMLNAESGMGLDSDDEEEIRIV
ncbi:hypothetical protein AM587_10015900 [Phytophthora nicotianae]|uniref:Uncharacterized protein n=1 Tax=Phytophthora nicotianae TaxID=4792 RepID=A0A0W8BV85_PHYNI|nr:hypothetical protein AM587_10016553 [Phytophthora nicotianae]KUG01180.1 hypothetical protein AM587_10015900 [Phytophthora nicotianae]